MFSNPSFDSCLPRDCASCTGDRSSVVYSLSVFSSGLIMLRLKFPVVGCIICSNIYKMADFLYKSLVHYYAQIGASTLIYMSDGVTELFANLSKEHWI